MKKRTYGTHEIARICQVTPPTISRWIEEGKLASYKTVGGHRRVWDEDLIQFLKDHGMPLSEELTNEQGCRILVVDDEAPVRRLVLKIVAKVCPAAETMEAVDGFEAGHRIASDKPTLVVLDIRLPGVDGYRVCQMVRSDEKLHDVKILAITGYDVEEASAQIMKAGADDFLAKPFTFEQFAEKLQKLLPGYCEKGMESVPELNRRRARRTP